MSINGKPLRNLEEYVSNEVKKLKNPRQMTVRWARQKRWEIPGEFRTIFDVETDPDFFMATIEEKAQKVNRIKEHLGVCCILSL